VLDRGFRGDKTLATVMRYAHLAPDYKLDAVERVAATFPNSKTGTKPATEVEPERLASSLVQ